MEIDENSVIAFVDGDQGDINLDADGVSILGAIALDVRAVGNEIQFT